MVLLHAALALAWALLTSDFSIGNLFFGWLLAWVVLWVTAYTDERRRYQRNLPRWFRLGLTFFKELVVANLRVAVAVVRPTHHLRPAIVTVPLDLETDTAITVFANLITLTPGTLNMDVADDRKSLLVHVMDTPDPDAFVAELKRGLERRVKEAMEP
jgi:multicomponent Na+:H+ antiporter subunit E